MMVLNRVIRSHAAIVGLLILFLIFVLVHANVTDPLMLTMAFFVGGIIALGKAVTSSARQSSIPAFGLVVVVGLATLGIFNYFVNPFSLYAPHLFEPSIFAARTIKMDIYTTASQTPEAIVFGNSRSFSVDTSQITKLWHVPALNLSVGSGTISDDLALIRFILEKGKMPKLLIMSLSPERFIDIDPRILEPYTPLWNYLDDEGPINNLQFSISRWTLLFSREQTAASLRTVQTVLAPASVPDSRYFDNTGVVRNDTRHPADDEFDLDKLEKDSWIGWFTETINPHMETQGMERLKQILDIAKAHNTLVIGYTPPIHLTYRAFLDTHTDFEVVRNRINDQIRAIMNDYNLYYLDFMDDATFSDGQTMFHDRIHPTDEATHIMMQALYDQYQLYTKTHNKS